MIRIRTDALTRDGERLLLDGEPFSGIAYDVEESGAVSGNRCVVLGSVTGVAEAWDPSVVRVARDSLEFDDDVDGMNPNKHLEVYWHGSYFRGVAYDFDSAGRLITECTFVRATPSACREWYPSGSRRGLTSTTSGPTFNKEFWYPNGTRQVLAFAGLSAGWDKSGRLHGMSLKLPPGELWRLSNSELEVSNTLVLGEKGVNDALVLQLSGLDKLVELSLQETMITPRGLELFRVATDLRILYADDNSLLGDEDIHAFLEFFPKCEWRRFSSE